MHYTIQVSDAQNHFITLTWKIEHIHQDRILIQLPSWRPGRYELQNYAKNIRNFSIVANNLGPVPFRKLTKDCWEVDTKHIHAIEVRYEYYANQLDAGASYVDDNFLYLNPVNCFMYVVGRMDEEYELNFILPETYHIACQLSCQKHTLKAKSFDHLADSPLIASPSLEHYQFSIDADIKGSSMTYIHLWFQGPTFENMDKLLEETHKYCKSQIELFGSIPCLSYHFLYHILPTSFRHGVEHLDSTVIAMGPSSDWTNPEFYDSFMAISSHEFFHLWNIKRIRPTDMFPYDFTKENYSTLGYVYEGVTTYYGDLILLRSGVWTWEQYIHSFQGDFAKHLSNPGRYNYSVAETSFDTWLDGYVPGIPGRKVSIYTEGMLAAFIADIMIIQESSGRYSLDNVIREMYEQTQQHYRGYTETTYRNLLEKYAGTSFETYFNEVIWGKGHFEKWLNDAFMSIGLEVNLVTSQITKLKSMSQEQKNRFERWSGSRW